MISYHPLTIAELRPEGSDAVCVALDVPDELRDTFRSEPGQHIGVVPDLDSGEPAVTGKLRLLDRDRVVLLRDDPAVGTVCVHFPLVGYRITFAA